MIFSAKIRPTKPMPRINIRFGDCHSDFSEWERLTAARIVEQRINVGVPSFEETLVIGLRTWFDWKGRVSNPPDNWHISITIFRVFGWDSNAADMVVNTDGVDWLDENALTIFRMRYEERKQLVHFSVHHPSHATSVLLFRIFCSTYFPLLTNYAKDFKVTNKYYRNVNR